MRHRDALRADVAADECFAMLPQVITILPTYQCTAACKECCFECSPKVEGRIPLDRIVRYISDAVAGFPTVQVAVFSGGECFMLGADLDAAVAHAHGLGLRTRCVSNGYWATSPAAATRRLERLKEAGLDELNLSTGDDHQEFVPFERIVNGALAGAELRITTLIVVEGFNNSRFKIEDATADPRLRAYIDAHPNDSRLQILRNVWMPFHATRALEHDDHMYRRIERLGANGGCNNVLQNMVVTPDESLASCCGLTMEHIPEMKLGKLQDASIVQLIDRGLHDFLKRWIWLDGPEAVLAFAHSKDPGVPGPGRTVHPCETCAQFYLSPAAREAVRRHWHEIRDDVLFRYELKVQLVQGKGFPPPPVPAGTRLGHGDH